jgi:RNA polymerase sigma-70 factor (ECF subfamily)
MASSEPHEDLSTEELFRRFAPFVARFLFRLGVRSDGLDDVVQDVFLVVHRRGGYKSGPAKPTSYLATIATNAASAYRRRQNAQRVRSSDTEVEKLVSTNNGPVQVLEATERLRLLQAALDRLDPDFRSTLILADIEGESCASIAASMGVPTGTVYWRLHEARKRFQRALRAEEAGTPARDRAAQNPDDARSEPRERSSILALVLNPLWFFSGGRRLLRVGAAVPPVRYDVLAGIERHRQLANTLAMPSWAPPTLVASVAGPTAGIGFSSLGSAGLACSVAIVVVLFLHSKPHGPAEDAVRSSAIAPSAPVATPVAASVLQPEITAPPSAPSPAPSATPAAVGKAHVTERATPKRAPDDTMPPASDSSAPTPKSSLDEAAPTANDTQVEAQQIARAERLLSSNPAGALALVRDARARFKPSFLPEERDYVEVMALHALGRRADATAAAARFLGAYPGGAFDDRVRGAMAK